jgi:hypothetical protein
MVDEGWMLPWKITRWCHGSKVTAIPSPSLCVYPQHLTHTDPAAPVLHWRRALIQCHFPLPELLPSSFQRELRFVICSEAYYRHRMDLRGHLPYHQARPEVAL